MLVSLGICFATRTSGNQIPSGIHISMKFMAAPAAAKCCLPRTVSFIDVSTTGVFLATVGWVDFSGDDSKPLFQVSQLLGHLVLAEFRQDAIDPATEVAVLEVQPLDDDLCWRVGLYQAVEHPAHFRADKSAHAGNQALVAF